MRSMAAASAAFGQNLGPRYPTQALDEANGALERCSSHPTCPASAPLSLRRCPLCSAYTPLSARQR